MSQTVCQALEILAAVCFSWNSFKALKKRQQCEDQLQETIRCGEQSGRLDADSILNLRLEKLLVEREVADILKFWVVLGCLQLYDFYIEIFVFFIPFYYTIKLAILVWILLPKSRGASVIFEQILGPQIENQRNMIEMKLIPSFQSCILHIQMILLTTITRASSCFLATEHLEAVKEHLVCIAEAISQLQKDLRKPIFASRISKSSHLIDLFS